MRALIAAVAAVVALTACSPAQRSATAPPSATTPSPTPSPAPSPSPPPPPPSPAPAPPLPAAPAVAPQKGLMVVGAAGTLLRLSPGGAAAGRLRGGVIVPIEASAGGEVRVLTPCERRVWMPAGAGDVVPPPTVVLDPGHGGSESGAVGPGGLAEKSVNLEVARFAAQALRTAGITVALTREQDYRATLAFRAAVAGAVKPAAFVSIHHNSEPDGPLARPGTETYYQVRSPESKRLAGLVQEEVQSALQPFGAQWVGDSDAGAKWRLNSQGGDYYSILRRPGELRVTAALAELAFVSNPSEEALLARPDVQQAEGAAVARAIIRFLRTPDPGSGFTVPYPRSAPAGPGGGSRGCQDPS